MRAFLSFHPLTADPPNKPGQGGEETHLLRAEYMSGALLISFNPRQTPMSVLKMRSLKNRKPK